MSATLEEQTSGRITLGLRWLDSKLSRTTSSREFIPEIDGLRFIAIFFVVLFHSAIYVLAFQKRPDLLEHWEPGKSMVLGIIGNLYLGVQIFFVISGLVVALPFARAAIQGSSRPSLGRYFMRRLTRIEPPYILALLVMYYLRGQYRLNLPHLLAGLFYVHKWIFGTPNPINMVTWTLEAEITFYILAPWITSIYSIPGRAARWSWQLLLIAAASSFVHDWFLPLGPPLSSYSFMLGVPFFLAGILLADLYVSGLLTRSRRPAWDIVALLGLVALISCHYSRPGWRFTWLSPIMVMMMVVGGIKGLVFNRFLRFRPITLIGGMCYSIYLWHIPIMERLGGLATRLPRNVSDLQLTALYGLIAVPLIILFSIPIYYFTERPFMNGSGSRFIERVLRGSFAWLQSKLAGWFGPSKTRTDLYAQAASHEPS